MDFEEIHISLVEACITNDVSKLPKCILSEKGLVKFLQRDVLCNNKNQPDNPGNYMYIACEHNSYAVVKQLLLVGIWDVSTLGINNKSAMLIACEKGNLECLKAISSFGVSLHPPNTLTKESCIYVATFFGKTSVVEYLVNSINGLLDTKFEGGLGPSPGINYADIWVGLTSVAKTEESIKLGNLLLYIACVLKHLEIVKFFLTKGVNVNELLSSKSFFSSMFTPLAAACKNDDLKIAEVLLRNGAEISSSIANQYPEFTALLLKSYVRNSNYISKEETGNSQVTSEKDIEHYSLHWNELRLHKLHRCWLATYSENIYILDLHGNSIDDLPFDFFDLLPNIEDIDLSCNLLTKFPAQNANLSPIKRLVVCKNKLKGLPLQLFDNPNITHIDFSANQISDLPADSEQLWGCSMLKYLKLSYNKIVVVPLSMTGAMTLEKLFLNDNLIQIFLIAWNCPLIELDLSNNQLVSFTPSIKMWSKTLNKLNLSYNQIETISINMCHLQNLQYLDLSFNTLRVLPPPVFWKCGMLCKLNLSHNLLSATTDMEGFFGVDLKKLEDAIGSNSNLSAITSCEFPAELFSENLTNLDLSYNLLENVPESLFSLHNLHELDLSNNPCLTVLPAELGKLKNIWNLKLAGLKIPDLPFELDNQNQAKRVLPYLRAKLRKSVPFNRMKLMVVGLQGRGKTTLIATLQGKKPPPNISTAGISVEQWSLALPHKLSINFWRDTSNNEEILFSCWDLAGQHVYYATHQCFLTSNTLYLVVFNVTHGREGVDSLAPWLLNIQARAPLSRVIIVGTHIDSLPVESRASTLLRLKDEIFMKYDKKGFPLITGCDFISNISSEGLGDLRIEIYNVARQMNETGNYGTTGKKAPLSYVQLYDSILKENKIRKEEIKPPILSTEEMLQLAQQNPDNDIFTVEELVTAAKFLHENGILLHFNDHMRELNTLYFIDPSWLCEMLSLVVTVRERNPFVLDGYIKVNDLLLVLKNPRLPEKFIPQYLRLLERFEIVLQLDDQRFLIPSMLPNKRPEYVENISKSDDQYIQRNYHMHYIPPGFWSRLIARIIVAVTKWGTDLCTESESKKDHKTIFWREGILVSHEDNYFLMESFIDDIEYENQSNKGISITVWSRQQRFSAMAFIVDHLDALIAEWYPGLEDVDEFGDLLVKKLIPCPICVANLKNNCISTNRCNKLVHSFCLNICALAAVSHQTICCPKHPEIPVPLNLLVPDLLLSDLSSELIIPSNELDFNADDSNRLGEGGAGGVYLGRYKHKKVAIKQFHSATNSKKNGFAEQDSDSAYVPTTESSLKMQIEEAKVIRGFWELRQEVAILCRLQHPNIVHFIGVCHRPLCFVLELAPMGSLRSTLERIQCENELEQTKTNRYGPVLGELLTHKIALQVADALSYLHKSEIIYRDLKSDNILLWSLEEDDQVNVKLSDYGISTFATPQGVIGEGGTPGFQAPEVRVGWAYDEKVDIFSYGIWLYELVSGYRPYREYRSASEMKRAVQRGVRPDLRKDEIDINMPYIEAMMKECWQENPIERPSAYDIVCQLQNIGVYLLKHIFEDPNRLNKVTCIGEWIPENKYPVNQNGAKNRSFLLIWCQKTKSRTCVIVDMEKKVVEKNLLCAGPRVLCLLQVESFVWLGTEDKQIEVFGQAGSPEERILWNFSLKDHVMSMLLYHQKVNLSVIASLANGTLAVFRKPPNFFADKLPLFSQKADIVDFEKGKWSDTELIDLGTCGLPAKCMTLTRFNTELWVGSGNMMVIVNPESLKVIERIKVLRTARSLITAIVTDEENVWIADWRSSIVTQWCVKTRSLLYSFRCDGLHPLGQMLVGQTTPEPLVFIENPEPSSSSEPSTPIIRKKDNVPGITLNNFEYNETDAIPNPSDNIFLSNLDFNSVQESLPESSLIKKFKHNKRLSVLFQNLNNKDLTNAKAASVANSDNSVLRPRTSAVSHMDRVTCLHYIEGALWIGRSFGDIIILNVKRNDKRFSCVIAHLDKLNTSKQHKLWSITGFAALKESSHLVSLVKIEEQLQSLSIQSQSLKSFEKHQLYLMSALGLKELFFIERKLFGGEVL